MGSDSAFGEPLASEIIEKFWAKVPGIYICIEEVENFGTRVY